LSFHQKRHKVWQVKQTVDKSKGRALVEVSAIFMLPAEFRANSDDVESDEEIVVAQWVCQVESVTFEKPKKHLHLKALYLKGFIDGKPLTNMLVDGGAAVNLMSYSTFRKLGNKTEVLCLTDMRLTDFCGNILVTKCVICVELTVLPTTFFVVDAKGTYSLLLGRDWIHANCCVPSTMHQSLIQSIGDDVEVVPVNSSVSISYAGTDEWNFKGMECFSRKIYEGDIIKVFDDNQQPIQAVGS
jgi:hypothetical protein